MIIPPVRTIVNRRLATLQNQRALAHVVNQITQQIRLVVIRIIFRRVCVLDDALELAREHVLFVRNRGEVGQDVIISGGAGVVDRELRAVATIHQ